MYVYYDYLTLKKTAKNSQTITLIILQILIQQPSKILFEPHCQTLHLFLIALKRHKKYTGPTSDFATHVILNT